MVKLLCSNFRIITAAVLGVRIFQTFTVNFVHMGKLGNSILVFFDVPNLVHFCVVVQGR